MGYDYKFKGKMKTFLQVPILLTILVVAFAVFLFFIDEKAGIAAAGLAVVYFLITIFVYKANKPLVITEMIEFAKKYGSAEKRLFDEFEIPYAVLDKTGKILWINKKFSVLVDKPDTYHKSINTIFPNITREMIEKNELLNVDVAYEDKSLRVCVQRVYVDEIMKDSQAIEMTDDKQYISVVYVFDETEIAAIKKENIDNQLIVGLVYIDNYDEIMDAIEDVKQSLLVALIDRKVSRYFASVDGLVKKIETDKYFVVFKNKYLNMLCDEKFSLLEDVKSVKVGNDMAMTLSMGLGFLGNDYNKNYEASRMAIDLALGRGGDQVVLKLKDKTNYFGGSNRQYDKNTRVKARVKALALREIIISKDKFYIMGHKIADVDSFGAAIGIYCAARQLGKKAQIVIDTVNTSLKPVKDCFTPDKGYPEDMFISSQMAIDGLNPQTALIVVDTNRPNMTECPTIINRAKTLVVFDHHRQSSDVIKNATLSYIEPYASSACEMIAEVLQYFDESIKLSPAEADAIYAGIIIDTNNFVTKTGVRTFEAAAYLRRCGADVTRVRKMLRNDLSAYKARAEAVRHAEIFRNVFAISICPADNIESPTVACAQAANELLNIVGIKASFVLTDYNGKIYVSSRSIDEINVQLIMERLGGGGHLNTAGAQFTNVSLDKAKRMVMDMVEKMIEEGDIKE